MYKEQIERYIEEHREEMLQDILRLCRIDSQKGAAKEGMPFGEGPYAALMDAIELAKGYGFAVKNYDNYVLAVDLNDREKQLDILAHLDVVPEGEGWTECAPFDPVIKGDKIFGRGTSDDKGPAVASLYALRCIKDLGLPVSRNARLILGTDEECGSSCIEHYYKIEEEAPMSFSPDGEYPVVNIEKGQLQGHFVADFTDGNEGKRLLSISAGTKINVVPPKAQARIAGFSASEVREKSDIVAKETGICFEITGDQELTITALGENAHASLPENGNNAITGLLLLLNGLDFTPSKKIEIIRNLYHLMPHGDVCGEGLGIKQSDEKSGALSLAFSMLTVDGNGLEGYFDSRCPVCTVPEELLSACREKFHAAGMRFLNTSMRAPHEVPGDSAFVQTLNRVYEDYTGLKGGCIAIGGGTYVHNLKNGVAFGAVLPGTDTRMHGADEFAVIEELVVTAKIIAQVIVDLCA